MLNNKPRSFGVREPPETRKGLRQNLTEFNELA